MDTPVDLSGPSLFDPPTPGYVLPPAHDLNLDAMTSGDLQAFAMAAGGGRVMGRTPLKIARHLFPHRREGITTASDTLRSYAWNRTASIACRRRGDITGASVYDLICDRLYQQLPTWARGW